MEFFFPSTTRRAKKVKDRVETTGRLRGKYLADLSHKIRTQMNGIIGMCNLLTGTVSDPEQLENLRIIQSCANSLLDIFYDFLDFSTIEAGKIELENEPIAIHDLVKELIELHGSQAAAKGLKISYNPHANVPEWIMGDSARLRQVLTNIIGNAVKFSDSDRESEIEISSQASSNGVNARFEIQFAIKDHGVGVSEESLKMLFNPQGGAQSVRHDSAGLGLVICKGLCEKMGGRIWVESELGKGSTFTFTFMAHATYARETSKTHDPLEIFRVLPQISKNLRILIVEDSRVNQQVATGLLKKLGYSADIAGNGVEALECAKQKQYDLILMDCQMPEMDGYEATRQIRLSQANREGSRIIALTASLMKEDVDRCMASGMDGVLGKPMTLHELIDALKSCQVTGQAIEAQQSASSKRSMIPIETFDKEKFLEAFSGIEDIAESTLKTFMLNLPQMLHAIEQATQRQDAQALELAAHTVKGAVAIFYAKRSRNLANQIEHDAHGKNFAKVPDTFIELKLELEILELALKDLVPIKKSA